MVPKLMKLEYCSAALSPYYPTLKPSVTHNRAKHTQPTNQTSQSRYLPLNLKLFPHKYSHSSSQSRKYSHSSSQSRKYSHSPSQSRDLPHSPSPSCSWSPSRAVAHSLGLPLTRYVSLSLHVQLVGIFVCKFVIFMHNLILGFDPEINLILGFDQFSQLVNLYFSVITRMLVWLCLSFGFFIRMLVFCDYQNVGPVITRMLVNFVLNFQEISYFFEFWCIMCCEELSMLIFVKKVLIFFIWVLVFGE